MPFAQNRATGNRAQVSTAATHATREKISQNLPLGIEPRSPRPQQSQRARSARLCADISDGPGARAVARRTAPPRASSASARLTRDEPHDVRGCVVRVRVRGPASTRSTRRVDERSSGARRRRRLPIATVRAPPSRRRRRRRPPPPRCRDIHGRGRPPRGRHPRAPRRRLPPPRRVHRRRARRHHRRGFPRLTSSPRRGPLGRARATHHRRRPSPHLARQSPGVRRPPLFHRTQGGVQSRQRLPGHRRERARAGTRTRAGCDPRLDARASRT